MYLSFRLRAGWLFVACFFVVRAWLTDVINFVLSFYPTDNGSADNGTMVQWFDGSIFHDFSRSLQKLKYSTNRLRMVQKPFSRSRVSFPTRRNYIVELFKFDYLGNP